MRKYSTMEFRYMNIMTAYYELILLPFNQPAVMYPEYRYCKLSFIRNKI